MHHSSYQSIIEPIWTPFIIDRQCLYPLNPAVPLNSAAVERLCSQSVS
jgi:hypothetical protein